MAEPKDTYDVFTADRELQCLYVCSEAFRRHILENENASGDALKGQVKRMIEWLAASTMSRAVKIAESREGSEP